MAPIQSSGTRDPPAGPERPTWPVTGDYRDFAQSIEAEIDRVAGISSASEATSAGSDSRATVTPVPTTGGPARKPPATDSYIQMDGRPRLASQPTDLWVANGLNSPSSLPHGSPDSPLPRYDDLPDPPPLPEALMESRWIHQGSTGSTLGPLEPLPHLGPSLASRAIMASNPDEPQYARVDPKYKRNSRASNGSRLATPRRSGFEGASPDHGSLADPDASITVSLEEEEEDPLAATEHLLPATIQSEFLPPLDLTPQDSTDGSAPAFDPVRDRQKWTHDASDAIQAVTSALYCKILVILGLAFPMAETISDSVPQGYYQLFYVYLFLVSLLYLTYVYIDVVRTRAQQSLKKKRFRSQSKKRRLNLQTNIVSTNTNNNHGTNHNNLPEPNMAMGTGDDVDAEDPDQAIYQNLMPRPRVHYGSFYLRLGCVLFGIGSMIYSGIEIGMFFELNFDESANCKNLFSLLRPVLQMLFVFVQMYFVFLNQKMNIYKNKFLSRMGLMHIIATNLCVWLNVLILETSHEILEAHHHNHGGHSSILEHHLNSQGTLARNLSEGAFVLSGQEEAVARALTERKPLPLIEHSTVEALSSQHFDLSNLVSLCSRKSNIMSKLLADSGPFLFPCTIEYSLICAAVLFVMWKNIGEEHEHYKFQKRRRKNSNGVHVNQHLDSRERPAHHYSVDCTHANTGLFTGIFVMVITIISLIVFFVLIASPEPTLQAAAITLASMTELTLYCITSVAVLIGMYQVRVLWYDTTRKMELDNLLLIVAQTGVFIYAAFSIIGSFFQLQDHLLAFLASLATLVQTTLQTVFILDASSRFAYCAEQVRRKPGREVVTFLLVCNLAMWAINTLETNRADSHPIQVKFYGGDWAWPIITHISMPLAIFYRFHSTVCLCEIWKKSFKYKPNSMAYM